METYKNKGKRQPSRVSVICTVKNEEENIKSFLDSLINQSRIPDEIVIVDGGSTDRTIELLNVEVDKHNMIKLFVEEKANIAKGRNIAINIAKHEIIAVTDAGCILDRNWLRNIILPLENDNSIDIVSGWYEKAPGTKFQQLVASLTYYSLDKILKDPDKFLPSSRSIAFRKNAWAEVRGYPEHLKTAEDTLFDINLKKLGKNFYFAPNAIVYWIPSTNLKNLFTKHYNYSLGDGTAGLFPFAYFLSIHLPFFIILVLSIIGFFDNNFREILFLFLIAYLISYLYIHNFKAFKVTDSSTITLIILTVCIAKFLGYSEGVLRRYLMAIKGYLL